MKKQSITLLVVVLAQVLFMSCQDQTKSSRKAETVDPAKTIDSAKAVMQAVIDYSNKLDFDKGFEYYSGDADAIFVENGYSYSLDSMKAAYRQFVPIIELLDNKIKSWNIVTLGSDAVLGTLPIHVKIKAKGRDPYEFDYVWSCVVQKRNGKWLLIQTHESWQDFAKAMAAIMPPPETK